MNDFDEPNHNDSNQKLQIWCCDNCRTIHFKTGQLWLNFTKDEFIELTGIVTEIYNQELRNGDVYRLIQSSNQETEILVSQAIS